MPVSLRGEPRGAGDRGDDADRQVLLLQHRPLLDMQFDIGEQLAAGARRGADMLGIETELQHRLAHGDAGAVA